VRCGKGEETLAHGQLPPNTLIFADLSEAVQHIIAETDNA
jgi:D-glycero-D-manno-heptose 1,7-bisphosphate phosphatase